MTGILVLVVGPSGAGKDTLIAAAKAAFAKDPRIAFPRRLVTREAIPELEDHDTISWDEFRAGDFALRWEAHGLGYALPRAIEANLRDGLTVVANVSRKVIPDASGRFPCGVLVVTADPDVRAARLAGRGRESVEEVTARLTRDGAEIPMGLAPAFVVDNSGALGLAIDAFTAAIRRFSGSQ